MFAVAGINMDSFKKKLQVVGVIWGFDILCIILFMGVLYWI